MHIFDICNFYMHNSNIHNRANGIYSLAGAGADTGTCKIKLLYTP